MKITICGSMKFYDQMLVLQKTLEATGHTVYMPIMVEGVDYWGKDGASRVQAKKGKGLIGKHFGKIQDADAILVANFTKKDTENYVGANTFLEIGFANWLGKKIYFLNPLPDQPYIIEELQSIDPKVLNGDLSAIQS